MTTPDSEVEKMAREFMEISSPDVTYDSLLPVRKNLWNAMVCHILALQEIKRQEVILECAKICEDYAAQQQYALAELGANDCKEAILAKLENPESK